MASIPHLCIWSYSNLHNRIYWIDPPAYGFSAVLANEFKNTIIPCVATNLVPFGPGYTDLTYQACTGIGGAVAGATGVTGEQYLAFALLFTVPYLEKLWHPLGLVGIVCRPYNLVNQQLG